MTATMTKVLVVDDDPDLAIQIRHMLRQGQWTYEVQAVHGMENLPERLASREFDVWILDHHLTGISGSDLLRRLPPDDDRPPFVVLTMSPDPQLSQVYLTLGAADFLNKEELRPALLERTLRYVIARDSDRRSLDRQQQQLLRCERMATIGHIASGVAHEYNNLHAVILAALERLQRRIVNDPDTKRLMLNIIDSIHRSRRISDSLLRIGRQGDPDGTVIELQAQVHEMVGLFRTQAEKAGIDLRLTAGHGPLCTMMDAGDLQQVLGNLIGNSIHAVYAQPAPGIQVALRQEGGWASLTITDNGVGISPEDLTRVCQPFFSRKGAHDKFGLFPPDAGGTGLGLAVCQTLVENAGGKLDISSRVGFGTTAVVRLPLVPGAELAVSPTILHAPSQPGDEPLRVVMVDDNEQLCTLLAEECALNGVEMQAFTSPVEFLGRVTELRFDVLVLDWQMPGVSGLDVLERLADPLRPVPIPVIVISGESPRLPQPVPAGIRIGLVLPKPFRITDLILHLHQMPSSAG